MLPDYQSLRLLGKGASYLYGKAKSAYNDYASKPSEGPKEMYGPKEPYGPPKPTIQIQPPKPPINYGSGIRTSAPVQFSRSRAQMDGEFEQALAKAMQGTSPLTAFKDNTFDESGARAESSREFNPEFDRQRNQLNELINLDKKGTNEDYSRNISELAQLRGVNTINQSVRTNNLNETLGAAGTVRSGIGMRQAGLNTIRGVQDTEDVGRQETNTGQIKNLAIARTDNRLNTETGNINRNQQTTLAEELQKRRSKFQESEDKRRTDYSNDYYSSYNNAYTKALKVYGG